MYCHDTLAVFTSKLGKL